MPWKEADRVSLRREFVSLALGGGTKMRELCRRFGVSRKTGYKWLQRYQAKGKDGLMDLSRRPHVSPLRMRSEMEREVLKMRGVHPRWGGRKIHARLRALGYEHVPVPSTITEVLRRNGRLDAAEAMKHAPWKRFERRSPNELWQMDFKGHFPLRRGRCHPLTVLDDHSRFALAVQACADQQEQTVKEKLVGVFRRYGLPGQVLVDNGPPWGSREEHRHTRLTVWLMRVGVRVVHGRPYHPQTQGKDERFHRTLQTEVLGDGRFEELGECQRRFDQWRDVYNLERPHEALRMAVPGSRYTPSEREYPEVLPKIEYSPGDAVRKVQTSGELFYRGKTYTISKAFRGEAVALRPTDEDGIMDVVFSKYKVARIDLRAGETPS